MLPKDQDSLLKAAEEAAKPKFNITVPLGSATTGELLNALDARLRTFNPCSPDPEIRYGLAIFVRPGDPRELLLCLGQEVELLGAAEMLKRLVDQQLEERAYRRSLSAMKKSLGL